ncbi:MAG: tyrosine-type recombinase/integrase [Sarcina sp.]
MDKKIKEFIQQLEFNELTIQSYKYDLNDFNKYLKRKEIDYLNLEISDKQIVLDKYLNNLFQKGYKPKTINRRCISLNRFNKYFGFDGIWAKSVKIQKQLFLDDVLSSKEVNKLLSKCESKRDRAIIFTLYGTGIRVSELLKLKVNDISKRTIYIQGKYGKYREIILPGATKKAIKEYLEVRPKVKEQKLFIGRQGAITRQTVNYILNKYSKLGRVSKEKGHPHSFRHLFCKRLAEQGVSIDIIAELAGHENLETTRIYTKRTKNELESVLNNSFEI